MLSLLAVPVKGRPCKVLLDVFRPVLKNDMFRARGMMNDIPEWLEKEAGKRGKVYRAALWVASKGWRADVVGEILDMMEEKKVVVEEKHLEQALWCFARRGMLEETLNLSGKLKNKMSSYEPILNAVGNSSGGSPNDKFLAAMKLLNEAVAGKHHSLKIFQAGLSCASSWEQASVILKLQRKRCGVRHDTRSLNILLHKAAVFGSCKEVVEALLERMNKLGLERDEGTLSAVFNSYKARGDFVACIDMLRTKVPQKYSASPYTHAITMAACAASPTHPDSPPSAAWTLDRAVLLSCTTPELWRAYFNLQATLRRPDVAKAGMVLLRQIKDSLRADVVEAYVNATGEKPTHYKGLLGDSRAADIVKTKM